MILAACDRSRQSRQRSVDRRRKAAKPTYDGGRSPRGGSSLRRDDGSSVGESSLGELLTEIALDGEGGDIDASDWMPELY